MKLVQIKATRSSDRVNLIIDNYCLPFPVESLFKFSLSKNQDIDSTLFDSLLRESLSFRLYNYSLSQIALTPKTELILKNKLRLKLRQLLFKLGTKLDPEISSQLISDTLSKISSMNLLKPSDYINFIINRHKNNKSLTQISYLLRQAGIDPRSVDFSQYGFVDEAQTIQKLIQKKVINVSDLADFNTKNKIIAYFMRKGFSLSSVKNVIDDILNK